MKLSNLAHVVLPLCVAMYFVGAAFVHDVVYKSLVEPHVFISFSAAPKAVKIV